MTHKILVVDDEAYVRRLLSRCVTKLGHQAIEAEDGDETLELARRERPSVVLLDIHMPRLDGRRVIGELLRMDSRVVVIVVTGDKDLELAKSLMAAGARDYLVKPIDLHYLETALTSHLALLS